MIDRGMENPGLTNEKCLPDFSVYEHVNNMDKKQIRRGTYGE